MDGWRSDLLDITKFSVRISRMNNEWFRKRWRNEREINGERRGWGVRKKYGREREKGMVRENGGNKERESAD